MKQASLTQVLAFTRFLNQLQKVKRFIYIPGTTEKENDVEHSFQLAMLAWYIAEENSLPLNKEKVLMCALAHDVIEVYAGDTFLYSKDQAHLDSKVTREEEALERIAKEFPESEEIVSAVRAYMEKDTPESRFVYVLDKLQPVFQLYLDGGKVWKEEGVTLEMLVGKKADKMQIAPELAPYWDELLILLKKDEQSLFPST